MINTFITLLIISIMSNIFISDIPFKVERYSSKIKILDIILYIIYKVFTCANCLGYHTTWIYYLIFYSSPIGFIYGFITYLLVSIVDKILHTTSIF